MPAIATGCIRSAPELLHGLLSVCGRAAGLDARTDGNPPMDVPRTSTQHRHERGVSTRRPPAGSRHITFSFVPPGVNWALLGLPAGVALMVPTARSASSFRVRG